MLCDNAHVSGNNIGLHQCYNNQAEFIVTVRYHEFEHDTLSVCKECKKYLVNSARGHGY